MNEITWTCRFHPTDYFHEVGCPHQKWSAEDLQSALEASKQTNENYYELLKRHPELVKELSPLL